MSDCVQPVLAMVDMASGAVSLLEGIPDDVSPMQVRSWMIGEIRRVLLFQPCWLPGDQAIVFIGYRQRPYKLGLIYCMSRP